MSEKVFCVNCKYYNHGSFLRECYLLDKYHPQRGHNLNYDCSHYKKSIWSGIMRFLRRLI
jgi:hypothetical protein